MIDLSAARDLWKLDEGKYKRLLDRIVEILEKKVRAHGIFATVSGRTKGMPNLLKKLLKKGYGYDKVTDKAGARVIVRFRHEVGTILSLVEESFHILSKEDKAESLGHNKVGYSGVHYDVRLKPESVGPEDSEIKDLQCEIQIHTRCQNLWADMDHALSYKPTQTVPEDLHRQIYLLNALLEIADRNFSAISNALETLPGARVMGLFNDLERHFYYFTGQSFDPELSQQILDNILAAYDPSDLPRVRAIIDEFVQTHEEKLRFMFDEYQKVEDRPLLLFQPETFVLLERLEKNPHVLEEIWTAHYPHAELERLGLAWGAPLD